MTESAGPNFSDNDAVAELHQEMAQSLGRLARAMLHDQALAEDAVQDAFMLFAARCTEIPPHQRRGWLVRTVQFSALNLRRSRQRQTKMEQTWLVHERASQYLSDVSGSSPSDGERVEQAEEIERLRVALSQLPEGQQLIVRLRLIEDKTFQQIADQLGLPLGTVLSRMRLAVEKLRSRLT